MASGIESTKCQWYDDDEELTDLTDSDDEEIQPPPPPPPPPRKAKSPPPSPRKPKSAPVTAETGRSKVTRASTQNATETSRMRRGVKNAVPCLKPPRTTNYAASSLFEWIKTDQVDLNPEYQRGIVWSDSKQAALIGSLFANYYVPPIVFTVKQQDDGSEVRVCIDGKQRMTSIYRFMLGDIHHKPIDVNRKTYFTNENHPSKRKLISDAQRNIFKNKQITCVEYEGLTAEQEREIFSRVQLGVSLSPADRLPAINGPYGDLVRELCREIHRITTCKLYHDWGNDNHKGRDFQSLTQLVYLIKHGHLQTKADPTLLRIENFLNIQARDPALETLAESATNVIHIFCRLIHHRKHGVDLQDMSPLEWVLAGYLIFTYRKKLSDTQLGEALRRYRAHFAATRESKKKKLSPTLFFKAMLAYVQKGIPLDDLKRVKGERSALETPFDLDANEEACSSDVDDSALSGSESSSSIVKKPIGKRKRTHSDASDSIIIPPSKKRAAPKEERKTPAAAKTESLLKPRLPSDAAKTVVKPASKPAPATEKKRALESQQVAIPSVLPPASAKTGVKASVGVSATSSSSIGAGAPRRPPPNMFISRPPLPGRARTSTSTTPPLTITMTQQVQLPPPQQHEVSTPAPQAPASTHTDDGPSRARPPASSTGGQPGLDRLAALRLAKAGGIKSTTGVGGAAKAGASQSSSVSISASVAKKASLPKFNKNVAAQEDGEKAWTEGIGQLFGVVGARPLQSAAMATPSASPTIPQGPTGQHTQLPPAPVGLVSVAEMTASQFAQAQAWLEPTRDPRIVHREKVAAAATSALPPAAAVKAARRVSATTAASREEAKRNACFMRRTSAPQQRSLQVDCQHPPRAPHPALPQRLLTPPPSASSDGMF